MSDDSSEGEDTSSQEPLLDGLLDPEESSPSTESQPESSVFDIDATTDLSEDMAEEPSSGQTDPADTDSALSELAASLRRGQSTADTDTGTATQDSDTQNDTDQGDGDGPADDSTAGPRDDTALGSVLEQIGDTPGQATESAADSEAVDSPDASEAGALDEIPTTSGESLPADSEPTPDTQSIATSVSAGDQVFLLGHLQQQAVESACATCLESGTTTPSQILFVTVTQPPTQRLESWRTHARADPAEIGLIPVGTDQQLPSEAESTTFGDSDMAITTRSVTNASDLSRLGMTISSTLSDWEDTPGTPTLCLHSLTALLQYVSDRDLFQFLHILLNKLRDIDATGHYHIDPTVHDAQTVSTFTTLFDTQIRVTGDAVHIEFP